MSRVHPWMYRLGFPGFAETLWVLPAGVLHDDPLYEPLPWLFACASLRQYMQDPYAAERFLAMYEDLDPLARASALEEEIREGRLVVWALRVVSVTEPALLPLQPEQPRPPGVKQTWIEIVLVDDRGAPVANEPYRVVLPDGKERSGSLDENGFVRIDGIVAGQCDVTFPKIDGREWGPSAR